MNELLKVGVIADAWDLVGDAGQLVRAWGPSLVVGTGVVALILATLTVFRTIRKGHGDRVATWLAVALATGLAAEGMWEVAVDALDLHPVVAGALFAAFEVAMTSAAIHARRRVLDGKPPGLYGTAVWVIAAAAGITAATNADNPAEVMVRAGMPLLAAGLWHLELCANHEITREPTSWRWTPRRLLIRIGALTPGEADLAKVNRQRQVDQLVRVAYQRHKGWARFHAYYGRRLRTLTLAAPQDVIGEVLERLRQVYQIEDHTSPEAVLGTGPGGTDTGTSATGTTTEPGGRNGAGLPTEPLRNHRAGTRNHQGGTATAERSARTRNRATGTSSARQGGTSAMRRFWDKAIAKGSVPTPAQLAEAGDTSDSFGRRKFREWSAELDLQNLAPSGTGGTTNNGTVSPGATRDETDDLNGTRAGSTGNGTGNGGAS